jgi:hypothetical protein
MLHFQGDKHVQYYNRITGSLRLSLVCQKKIKVVTGITLEPFRHLKLQSLSHLSIIADMVHLPISNQTI